MTTHSMPADPTPTSAALVDEFHDAAHREGWCDCCDRQSEKAGEKARDAKAALLARIAALERVCEAARVYSQDMCPATLIALTNELAALDAAPDWSE